MYEEFECFKMGSAEHGNGLLRPIGQMNKEFVLGLKNGPLDKLWSQLLITLLCLQYSRSSSEQRTFLHGRLSVFCR